MASHRRKLPEPLHDQLLLHLQVLDHQIEDVDGKRCGKVDDVVLHRTPDGAFELAALQSGSGALVHSQNGGAWSWVARLGGERSMRVPWAAVRDIGSTVRLAYAGSTVGLGGEHRARSFLERLLSKPMSDVLVDEGAPPMEQRGEQPLDGHECYLSDLFRSDVVRADGSRVGKVYEVRATRIGRDLGPVAGKAWVVDRVYVGARNRLAVLGVREAAGIPFTMLEGTPGKTLTLRD